MNSEKSKKLEKDHILPLLFLLFVCVCACVCLFPIFFGCFSQEIEKAIAQRNLLIVNHQRIKFFARAEMSI